MTTPCTKEKDIEEIKLDIKSILRLMNGNGKIGFITMARLAYDYTISKKKDSHDIAMYVYRFVVAILLTFIAVKLGIA